MKELPDFSRHLGSDFNPEHLAMMTLSPSIDQCQNAWNDAQNGRITETPIMQLQTPSVYDKTVAPEGHHVLSLWIYYLPPHLPDGPWSDMRQQYGEWLIDYVTQFAPKLQRCHHRLDAAHSRRPSRKRIGLNRRQHSPPRHDPPTDDVPPSPARMVRLPFTHQEPLPLRRRWPPRRRGYRRSRPQRRAHRPRRSIQLNANSLLRTPVTTLESSRPEVRLGKSGKTKDATTTCDIAS